VAFGFDEGPDRFDRAGLADEEGTADDAHEFAAHELLLLPGSEGLDGFVIGVAEQRKIELLFSFEGGLSFDGISAHAEDGHTEFVEFFLCVTKLGRFDGSTRSVGFGVEKKEDRLALEVFQRDFFAFVGWETEVGGSVADFQH
jgi:hypothetical protein